VIAMEIEIYPTNPLAMKRVQSNPHHDHHEMMKGISPGLLAECSQMGGLLNCGIKWSECRTFCSVPHTCNKVWNVTQQGQIFVRKYLGVVRSLGNPPDN